MADGRRQRRCQKRLHLGAFAHAVRHLTQGGPPRFWRWSYPAALPRRLRPVESVSKTGLAGGGFACSTNRTAVPVPTCAFGAPRALLLLRQDPGMNWTLYLAIWGALALSVPCLALYRKWIATEEDDSIRVSGDGSVIEKQKFISHKLEAIDRWGKVLTVVTFVLGLVLVAVYVYVSWQVSLKPVY